MVACDGRRKVCVAPLVRRGHSPLLSGRDVLELLPAAAEANVGAMTEMYGNGFEGSVYVHSRGQRSFGRQKRERQVDGGWWMVERERE